MKEKPKVIETESFSIRGNIISWKETIIQISNISMISTSDMDKQRFPYYVILLLLASFWLMGDYAALGVILLLLCVGIVALWIRKKRKLEAMKRLSFVLNSGGIFTLVFDNKKFLDETVDVLTELLTTSKRDVHKIINIHNSTMQNCNVIRDNVLVGSAISVDQDA